MFLPTTKKEVQDMGWDGLDVILVTGDAYVDAPHIGVAVIGNVLADAGFRVGVIAQPDPAGEMDIARLGEPELFWGVTGGCMDSMVANYTATKKKRKQDDLTAGGENTRRPDRAVIVYANLIRRHFKNTRPIVLGGMEASLRRISHYDYWSDKVRRSILFDAKADILVYGMGEHTVLELAEGFKKGRDVTDVRGICYAARQKPEGFLKLPPHSEAAHDKAAFKRMFQSFYENTDTVTGKGLCQLQDTRYLVCNPPQEPLGPKALDRIYELPFERDAHPGHESQGPVRALDTIRFSITTHRGCYGECHFCAITAHQGRTVTSRSEASIVREAESLRGHPAFKGVITDVGGPTANMYGMECRKSHTKGACPHRRCLGAEVCADLPVSHYRQRRLLKRLREIPDIKHVFVASGIRHELILADRKHGQAYLKELIAHHVSGQLKIAPEHCQDRILALMGKPPIESTRQFVALFNRTVASLKIRRYLTCYFIAAYPGCTIEDMAALQRFTRQVLRFTPEQVQVFTPTPATVATLMYHTASAHDADRPLFVEKDLRRKEKQKRAVQSHTRDAKKD